MEKLKQYDGAAETYLKQSRGDEQALEHDQVHPYEDQSKDPTTHNTHLSDPPTAHHDSVCSPPHPPQTNCTKESPSSAEEKVISVSPTAKIPGHTGNVNPMSSPRIVDPGSDTPDPALSPRSRSEIHPRVPANLTSSGGSSSKTVNSNKTHNYVGKRVEPPMSRRDLRVQSASIGNILTDCTDDILRVKVPSSKREIISSHSLGSSHGLPGWSSMRLSVSDDLHKKHSDVAEDELMLDAPSMGVALMSPELLILVFHIFVHAVCNSIVAIILLYLAYYLAGHGDDTDWCGVKFGIQPILIATVSMGTFVIAYWERPFKQLWKYIMTLLVNPILVLAVFIAFLTIANAGVKVNLCGVQGANLAVNEQVEKPAAKEKNVWNLILLILIAIAALTAQVFTREVQLYFKCPNVTQMYHQRSWPLPGLGKKVLYVFKSCIIWCIILFPIVGCMPYTLFIRDVIVSMGTGVEQVYSVLLVLHMAVFKLLFEFATAKSLLLLLEQVNAMTVLNMMMGSMGFFSLATKMLVASSVLPVAIVAGIASQLTQTCIMALQIRRIVRALPDLKLETRDLELRKVRILMLIVHGDFLLQLQSVIISAIMMFSFHAIRADHDTAIAANNEWMGVPEHIIAGAAQIVAEMICTYILYAFMVHCGLSVTHFYAAKLTYFCHVVFSVIVPVVFFMFYTFA